MILIDLVQSIDQEFWSKDEGMIVRNETDRERAAKQVQTLDLTKRWQVEIKPYKKKRSLAQNSLLWMWYTEIRDHLRETTGQDYNVNDLHEYFKQELLPKKAIQFRKKVINKQIGTSELNVQEMTDFLFHLDRYCAEKINLLLTHPEDLYMEAMQK